LRDLSGGKAHRESGRNAGKHNVYCWIARNDQVRGLLVRRGYHVTKLPLGARATLDVDERTLTIDEAAISL
jgi:hypothetical protein